jgi:hypothetical protein
MFPRFYFSARNLSLEQINQISNFREVAGTESLIDPVPEFALPILLPNRPGIKMSPLLLL